MGFEIELTRPWLMMGIILIPWFIYYFYRSLVDFPKGQRLFSLCVRAAVFALLLLSLAGLTVLRKTTQQFVIFVSDASMSVGDKPKEKVAGMLSEVATHAGDHKYAFLSFAEEPGELKTEFSEDSLTTEANKATHISAAVEVAAAAIPPFHVPKIVLLTDGNETRGSILKAAVSAGIPIATIPVESRDDPEVQVSAVEAPAQVHKSERFQFKVIVDSNHETWVKLNVFLNDYKEDTIEYKVKKGENVIPYEMDAEFDGLATISVNLERSDKADASKKYDTLLDNNEAKGLVYSAGQPRVMLIERERKARRFLVDALRTHGIDVSDGPPEFLPESLSELQKYDAVVISNVPAVDISIRKMENLRSYVQELGGGLIMLGGDQSFGLGGYYKTTLEEILPVRSDFEKEKEKPSLAMVLIIDKSGSMGGMKMEMAKDAAKSAVELLGPRDQVGVIAFDGNSYWVSEIHSAADKNYIVDRIATIEASGGTSIYPAMEDALSELSGTVAKLKHVILLTDGHSSPGDFEGVTSQMAAARITVSTVAVGSGADRGLLEEISQTGNGRYYECDDPQTIPQIFAKETVTASKSAINEEPFIPQVIMPTSVLSNVDMDAAPFLLGFVVTKPKRTSEIILATETGEPLLVWWRYGLGMSVAFTSDAKSRWAAEWLSWGQFSTFWTQIVRNAMRKSETRGVFVDVSRKDNRALVTMDSVDKNGFFRNKIDTELTVLTQTGKEKLPLRQIAPGRYQTSFDAADAGSYQLMLTQKNSAGKTVSNQSRGMVVGYADELRLKPVNEELLKKVSQITQASYNPSISEVFNDDGREERKAEPLWPYLLSIAAILFLIDVAVRRIDFSLILGRG